MIYHIISKDNWMSCKNNNEYKPHSLLREGYIHCSFENQVMKVADTFHKGQNDLCILCINEKKLDSEFKVEDLFNLNEEYPHIYGSLSFKAIDKVVDLELDSDGSFITPDFSLISSLHVDQREWT